MPEARLSLSDAEMRSLEEITGVPEGWSSVSRPSREVWLLRKSTSPMMSLQKIATRLGLSHSATVQRWQRAKKVLGEKSAPPGSFGAATAGSGAGVGERGEVVPKDLESAIDQKIWSTVQAIDKKRIDGATYQHLTRGLKDLTDVRALIRGEPTQIIRHEKDREELGELLAIIQSELSTRHLKERIDPLTNAVVIEAKSAVTQEGT